MSFLKRELQKMVLLVRTDLNMGKGKIAAQCAHAALECYLKGQNSGFLKSLAVKYWLTTGQIKVVLQVPNEKELIETAETASKAGLITVAIRDEGRTQVKPGTITVVGIGPGEIMRVDSVTQHLKLL